MTAIERCRTAALGGHVDQCDQCGTSASPTTAAGTGTAQSASRWPAPNGWRIAAPRSSTPSTSTSSSPCRRNAAIAYQNKEIVYGILFRTAAETLRTIAADPRHLGAEIGFFAVCSTPGARTCCTIRTCTAS